MTCPTCFATSADDSRPNTPACAVLGTQAHAALERLARELKRLASHRDDAAATAALVILDELRAAGDSINAQTFQPIYFAIRRRRYRYDDTALNEWKAVHRISCSALEALVWLWRVSAMDCGAARVRSRGPQYPVCDANSVTR